MSTHRDDGDLLLAWRVQRDEAAFRELCDRHAGLVASICRHLGSPDPDEATQAVFLVLARRAGSVAGASLASWLIGTARRVVAHQRRAGASRRRHEQEAAVEYARHTDAVPAEPAWAEAREHLDAALASLSTGRREAVLRFYLEGRSQAEVAAELGCSEGAVKTRVHEGLERLRTFFARKGVALGSAALASGLAGESAAAEPALAASCTQAAIQPASAAGAAALATGVTTAMFIKSAALACAAVLVAGSAVTATLIFGAETPAPAHPPAVVAAPVDAERAEIDRLLDIAVQHGFPDARGATVWKGEVTVTWQGNPDPLGFARMNLQLADGSWVLFRDVMGGQQSNVEHAQASKGYAVDCQKANMAPVSELLRHKPPANGPEDAAVAQYLKTVAESAHLPAADAAFLSRVIVQHEKDDIEFWLDRHREIGLLHLWRIGHPFTADMMHATCISRNMFPYHAPRIQLPGVPLTFRLASLDRSRVHEDVGTDAMLPAMRSTDFVRALLVGWALDRVNQVAAADRPQAFATAVALADPGERANIRRLEASLSVSRWPALDAPLASRLAAWTPVCGDGYREGLLLPRPEFPTPPPERAQEMERLGSMIAELQHEACSPRLLDLYQQQATLMKSTVEAWRGRSGLLITEADLDGLFALLDDDRPCRWIERGVSMTLGDNALRALAHLMQRDPRTLVGHPVDAAWTDSERNACARDLKAWWVAHRQQGLTPILDESLAALSLTQALARVGIDTQNYSEPDLFNDPAAEPEQRRLATALGRCWLAKPPKADECAPNLIPLVRFAVQMQSIPEVQRAFDGLSDGWSEFQACWKQIHGDSTALDALLVAGRTGIAAPASSRRVVDALRNSGLPVPAAAPVRGNQPPVQAAPPATSDF